MDIKVKIYFTEKKKARAPNYCQSEKMIKQRINQIQGMVLDGTPGGGGEGVLKAIIGQLQETE